jgi:hypothetical protein
MTKIPFILIVFAPIFYSCDNDENHDDEEYKNVSLDKEFQYGKK